jgi:3-oxoadipate enol-lactonase/4-carboxymuconolactone decarboxylase
VHAPARLGQLVLCNTAARIGTVESWNARIAAVEAGGTAAIADGALERWLTAVFIARHPEVAARARATLLATSAEGYVGCCAAIRDFDARPDLERIRTPTLVIAGAADVATPPGEGRVLAERIHGARLVVLPAAHLSNLEAEADFTAALLEFLAMDDRYAKGLAVRRAVLGDAYVDRALAGRTDFTAEFQEFITRYAWGEIWTRPGLPRATRSLLTIGMLVAMHREEELRLHVRGALRNGATLAEIKEVLLHAAIYCGVPAANSAFRVIADVLAGEGQP